MFDTIKRFVCLIACSLNESLTRKKVRHCFGKTDFSDLPFSSLALSIWTAKLFYDKQLLFFG
jgi:hypothetical protein